MSSIIYILSPQAQVCRQGAWTVYSKSRNWIFL